MPEYLAPGVFVEEVSFRQKTIEGVSTSTTGFVGATRFGPLFGEPPLLTSFADFERIYGGLDQLRFVGYERSHNFLAHAVRAYFQEGGRRLYVARAFEPLLQEDDPRVVEARLAGGGAADVNGRWHDGRARMAAESVPAGFAFEARYAGDVGNVEITVQLRLGDSILTQEQVDPSDRNSATIAALRGAFNYDTVLALGPDSTGAPVLPGALYWVERFFDPSLGRERFRLRANDPDQPADDPAELADFVEIRVVRASVTVGAMGRFGVEQVLEDLDLHPLSRRYIGRVFAEQTADRATMLYMPVVLTTDFENGAAIAQALTSRSNINDSGTVLASLADSNVGDAARSFRVRLEGGSDGALPDAGGYEGIEQDGLKSGLGAFEDIEDISIVAAPGSTFSHVPGDRVTADNVTRFLIAHCERMRYRVAVLDSDDRHTPGQVRQVRGTLDSTRAAFYYPWVRVFDPITEIEIHLPPSGFIAGIYARNDIDRGVQKAPANEVVRLATGLELLLNTAQQEALNPRGINCLRVFEGRGIRVWGARTASSDPEWKYLNVRRYFAFLERSIERGTQWAVFESNGDQLWAKVRRTISDFLLNEWKESRLFGLKPEQAFFVRCDRTTMSQNDIDNGRLICLIGVAPLRPAEFVIFRIGQMTADARA